MRDDMACARAEELLTDHLEGTLAEPLRGELDAHLLACAACRALREELAFVKEALHEFPEVEPSLTLASRVAKAALRASKTTSRDTKVVPFAFPSTAPRTAPSRAAAPVPAVASVPSRPRVALLPAWAQSMAAGLSLITLGTLLLTSRSQAPARAAAQIVGATVNTGAYLAERKDRLVEDVRVLRVVLETAFEGRVERVGERVEDYRKLLERRRGNEPEEDPAGRPSEGSRSNDTRHSFPNKRHSDAVTLS
jgi:Putative zinc-finger